MDEEQSLRPFIIWRRQARAAALASRNLSASCSCCYWIPCTSAWSRNNDVAEQSSIQQGQSRGSSLRPGAHGREEQKERGRNRQQVSTQPRWNEREQRTAHKRKSKRSAWGVLDSAQEREALLVDWPPGLPATDRCLQTVNIQNIQ